MSSKRIITIMLVIGALIGAAALGVWYAWHNDTPLLVIQGHEPKIRCPQRLLNEDFQTSLDCELTGQFKNLEKTDVALFVDTKLLKPFIDDVQTLKSSVEGVEITATQFPDRPELNEIIDDCARIMGISRPRVYVSNVQGLQIITSNFREPMILIPSSVLRRYKSKGELRFLIGREMGHIRCSHVKWLMVLRAIRSRTSGELAAAGLLPLLKWAREAEVSADRAGLICAQDQGTAETAIVRQALNIDEYGIGRINVDAFIKQRASVDNPSKFSEVVLLWRQITRDQPFAEHRIKDLRNFSQSRSYQHLWED